MGSRDLFIGEAHMALDIFRFAVFFLLVFSLRQLLFSKKECSYQKTYFAKVDANLRIDTFPDPIGNSRAPQASILDFASGVAL